MSAPQSRPVIIAAGGTGGHFFPAEALAAALMQRGQNVVLMTDARSGGLNSDVFANTARHVLAGAGLSGRGGLKALQGAFALARGTWQARRIMQTLRPGAVVAFGGYPAVAPVLAAHFSAAPPVVFLHEQNAVLGRANRLLARFGNILALTFAQTQKIPPRKATVITGNPVRPAIAALSGQGYKQPGQIIEILVLGGSLGAKIFGTLIPASLALLPDYLKERLVITQQCRPADMAHAQALYDAAKIKVTLSPFFHDVAAHLARAHLVIARAGASTVTELAVAGRPAIFIPLPGSIDDHQRENADALAKVGGAWRLDQALLTPQTLANKIETLLHEPSILENAAAAAASQGQPDAANRLADLLMSTMAGAPA